MLLHIINVHRILIDFTLINRKGRNLSIGAYVLPVFLIDSLYLELAAASDAPSNSKGRASVRAYYRVAELLVFITSTNYLD